jgi:hypothetical protein
MISRAPHLATQIQIPETPFTLAHAWTDDNMFTPEHEHSLRRTLPPSGIDRAVSSASAMNTVAPHENQIVGWLTNHPAGDRDLDGPYHHSPTQSQSCITQASDTEEETIQTSMEDNNIGGGGGQPMDVSTETRHCLYPGGTHTKHLQTGRSGPDGHLC